jgi:MFS family permease
MNNASTKAGFYGWTVLGAFWVIMCFNLGFPAYGASVINTAMAASLGMNRETLGMMGSAYFIMSGLPGPLVAISVNHFGVRRTIMIGSAMLIAGAVSMATWVHTGLGGVLGYGLLVGSGVATGGALASQAGLAKWFVNRRALVLSALYTAGSIGGFMAAPLLNRVIEASGGNWRLAWWVLAGLSACAAVVALLFVKEKPEDLGQLADGAHRAVPAGGSVAYPGTGTAVATAVRPRATFVTRDEWGYKESLATPAFWMMLVPFIGDSAGYTLFLVHGISHLKDLGHPAAIGAYAISVMTFTSLAVKAVIATLGDRIDPRYLWAAFCWFFGIGLVCLANAESRSMIVAAAMCIGVGFGGGIVAMTVTISNYYGTKSFASLAGLAVAINTSCGALASWIAGRLYDHGLGYENTFYFFAGWCLIGSLVLASVRRPQRRAAAANVATVAG